MPNVDGPGSGTQKHRRGVRSELDLLGLGITGLLADSPCHYSPLVLVGSPAATSAVLRDIHEHWHGQHADAGGGRSKVLFIDRDRLRRDLEAAAGDGLDGVHRKWTAAELVVIEGIAELTSPQQLATLPHLLDRIDEAGSRIVCSLTQEHGKRCELPAAITSRLEAGLMVTVRDPAGLPTPVEPTQPGPRPTARRILSATARHYDLSTDDLIGSSRRKTVALARGMAMHLTRLLCGESLAVIGRRFSGRDHTTVLHAIRVTQQRIERDAGIASDLEAILSSLGLGSRPSTSR